MKPGDVVTIKPPFDSAYPDQYPVVLAFADGSALVAVPGWSSNADGYDPASGPNFDGSFLNATETSVDLSTVPGAVPLVPVKAPDPAAIVVANAQARKAIVAAGLFPKVDAMIEAAGPTSDAYIAWHYAATFSSDSPLLKLLATQLGLTSAQITALFTQAQAVEF